MKSSTVFALLGLACGLLYLRGGAMQTKQMVEGAIAYIEAQGDNALAAYLAFTVFGVVFLVPTTLMEFSGGFLFVARYGMMTTWILTCLAKLVANVIAVFAAKHLLREWVRTTFVEKSELLMSVSEAVRQEPFKVAFLVRGSYVPLSVKNYGLGVLDIGYVPIAMASCIFTPFYAYQNIHFGSSAHNLKEIFSGAKPAGAADGWMYYVKTVLPIVCNVLLVVAFVRVVKAQIAKQRAAVQAELKAKSEKKGE